MDQTQVLTQMSKIDPESFQLSGRGNQIAFIQANWHSDIVTQSAASFVNQCEKLGIPKNQIEFFEVPGSLEIPLQAKLLAKTGRYVIIVAAGLIVDGGIYRHEFVASAVLDALMSLQLELEIPILSLVLTPHHFHEDESQRSFLFDHFKIKGKEAANACAMTLKNLDNITDSMNINPDDS